MATKNEIINFLIRNHFEKCLIDAEDHTWGLRQAKDHEPDQDQGELIRNTISNLKEHLNNLRKTALEDEFSASEEEIAAQLLDWQKFHLKPFDELFKDLARGIIDAKIEATRMQIAYLERDGENMMVRSALFQGCTNYLQEPNFKYSSTYEGKPYHGDPYITPVTLAEAADEYCLKKHKEGDAWLQANRPYLDRASDILGADRQLQELTHEDGIKLEERLWDIPSNYKRDYEGIPLAEFFAGEQGDYTKISRPTVKQYYIGIRAFFKWCKTARKTAINIMEDVPLNTPKSRPHKSQQRAYTVDELTKLFSCPLYTGHKYLGREYWVPGDQIERKGSFWIPLVALFAGLRMSEILFLRVMDVKEEDKITYLEIDTDADKTVKTAQSVRKIPIHPELAAIGFIKYVAGRRKQAKTPNEKLFDGITYPENGKIIKNFSRAYSLLLTKIGLKTDKRLNFHSLRHNYVSTMARIPHITIEFMDPLDGRETASELRGTRKFYNKDYPVAELYGWIRQMDFKIDLSHLYQA